MRVKTDPPPKVVRYYYLPDRKMSWVYDDGYKVIVDDTTQDDEGLRREGWVPITNEMSLVALKAAKREQKSLYLLYLNKQAKKAYNRGTSNDFDKELEKYWDHLEKLYSDGSLLSLLKKPKEAANSLSC